MSQPHQDILRLTSRLTHQLFYDLHTHKRLVVLSMSSLNVPCTVANNSVMRYYELEYFLSKLSRNVRFF